jgi:hypothetical protein
VGTDINVLSLSNIKSCQLCSFASLSVMHFTLQEEDLDCQQGVIDFSLYLRSSNQCSESSDDDLDHDNMTTVLDQKNYIEELNRHLKYVCN